MSRESTLDYVFFVLAVSTSCKTGPQWLGPMPYQLVPVLDQADETLQLRWTPLQEVSLELREAGRELPLQTQAGALLDEAAVDLGVRLAKHVDISCKGDFIHLSSQPFSEALLEGDNHWLRGSGDRVDVLLQQAPLPI